jgi:hypothetical protein
VTWSHQTIYVDKTSDCNYSKLTYYELVRIFATGIRRLVISTRAKLLGIKLSIDQSICNQNATLSAIKSIKSMLSVYLDQSIQVELEILIVLLVDNSAISAEKTVHNTQKNELYSNTRLFYSLTIDLQLSNAI